MNEMTNAFMFLSYIVIQHKETCQPEFIRFTIRTSLERTV